MADLSAAGRRKEAADGDAMPGGRFPITNREDVAKAIRAVGRAKGGEQGRVKVRKFIIKRARALNASGLIPASWGADGTLKQLEGGGKRMSPAKNENTGTDSPVTEVHDGPEDGGVEAPGPVSGYVGSQSVKDWQATVTEDLKK
ncbi:hypothetical protein ACPCTH_33545 [Streptomyces cellulosae]